MSSPVDYPKEGRKEGKERKKAEEELVVSVIVLCSSSRHHLIFDIEGERRKQISEG